MIMIPGRRPRCDGAAGAGFSDRDRGSVGQARIRKFLTGPGCPPASRPVQLLSLLPATRLSATATVTQSDSESTVTKTETRTRKPPRRPAPPTHWLVP